MFCKNCGAPLDAADRSPSVFLRLMLVLAVVVIFGIGAAVFWFQSRRATVASVARLNVVNASSAIHVGVAYGTEKREWFDWAVQEFAKTPAGRNVQIDLKPMGSLEAAQAIVRGDKSIQVWSPASSLYRDVFLKNWDSTHPGESPIASTHNLAMTPMVFVMWDERYAAFVSKYHEVNFRNIALAMNEPGGWNTIAGHADWGFFKFSHTHPSRSNSGLASLVLMASDFRNDSKSLTFADITNPAFQTWLTTTERNQVGAASGLIESTGTLMDTMVQRGWSSYDCVMVYVSNAIERLQQANGRWGGLRVVYPAINFWNENPFYVLNVPTASTAQKQAAEAFASFLLDDASQRQAMLHGFRPANVSIVQNDPANPFSRLANIGLMANVPGQFCESPTADVIESLQTGWQRSQAAISGLH